MSNKTKIPHSASSAISNVIYHTDFRPQEYRTKYTYDPIGQLTIATSSVSTENRGYAYDSAWNLNWRTNNGAASHFIVDTKNELTNWPGGPGSYDGDGNRITGNSGTGATSYYYDDEDRLYSIIQGTIFRTDFVYDGLGRMRTRTEYSWLGSGWGVSSITQYIYDGLRVIQERNSGSSPTVAYTRGTDLSGSLEGAGGIGGLLARSSGYSSGNWSTHYFYHADGNGNITYMVDSSQALAASYRYDPYGTITASSGAQASVNLYRFSSKEQHVNSGFYIYLYRFYDPGSLRWLNRDPLAVLFGSTAEKILGKRTVAEAASGPNAYAFVLNDPVLYQDGYGLWTFGTGLCGSVNWWIFNGSFSIGLVGDTQGNLNWWGTLGGGTTGAGAGASLGVTIQVSDGDSNRDLRGPFGYGSIAGFLGGGASVDGFWGNGSSGQPVLGGGVTVGFGLGAGVSAGASATSVKPLWPF